MHRGLTEEPKILQQRQGLVRISFLILHHVPMHPCIHVTVGWVASLVDKRPGPHLTAG